MSTALFFLVPIGMLAVVWSLCFVGVCFPTSGEAQAYSNYILQETNIIAYWPLSDLANQMTPPPPPTPTGSTGLGSANDLTGNGHIGVYLIPPAYPAGSTAPQLANPTATTGLSQHQPSIVPGDGVLSGSKNLPACVNFAGGYVNIPWAANSPSLTDFTLEAWFEPNAALASTAGFTWVLFSTLTTTAGFALSISTTEQGAFWQLSFGNGTTLMNIATGVSVISGYVAVTFNSTSQVLSLWVNPDSDTSAPPPAAWPPNPNTTTTYVASDSTQPATFFIGAGSPQLPLRMQAMGSGAPEAPFWGKIQSVALYDQALQASDLANHFSEGASSDTDS
jgi:hypothetical protein